MRVSGFRFAGLMFLFVAVAVHAEPQVPPALDAWRGWALHGQEFRACPLMTGKSGDAAQDFLCAWPGILALGADASGASIAQRWRVDAESWIPLPGDAEHWPVDVSIDGKPAPVVDRDGPALFIGEGSHDIRARIPWGQRPQTLRVPAAVGLVALIVDGKAVAPVQRDGDEITLGRAAGGAPEADSLELRVFRRLEDGVPALLTTRIEMSVSGQAREEIIGPALPDGFVPLALSGEWPARLDADGRLRVRVEPGSDTLTLEARATSPLASVAARVPPPPWPKQEIWSYAASPRLRVTMATSAVQVDPRQAEVPDEWRDLPAFALADGALLKIDERTRGLAPGDRNRLTLAREMWLDFDGSGWFARDRVHGDMLQGWRFDAATPYTLERAEAIGLGRGGDESLLVTRGQKPELTGVEWRTPAVDLGAGLRLASATAVLPVTGWQDTFDSVSATLHLPDGYRLLGAPGADSANGSWISQWTLLDVFIAAIVVLLAWRALGFAGALVTGTYLALGYQEGGTPVWSLLAAIALMLIVRALPNGRLAGVAEWLRRAALVVLVVAALPFAATELRYALHPQLESEGAYAIGEVAGGFGVLREAPKAAPDVAQAVPESAPAPPPAPMAEEATGSSRHRATRAAEKNEADRKLETVTVAASNTRRQDLIDHYSQSTVVQTGAGEPAWQRGQTYALAWGGPVLPTQNVRLVIAPPWLVRLLRVVLVALLAWLLVRLIVPSLRGTPGTPVKAASPLRASAAVIGAFAIAALGAAGAARAQAFPPENLLDELRTQLTEAPKCAPSCATIESAQVFAHADEIRMVLVADVAGRVAVPVPIDEKTLALRSIAVDGSTQDGLARHDGALWLALPRGVHRVELAFNAAADKIALAFPLKPMRAAFTGDGWEAGGLADGRLLTETMTLARARVESAAPADASAQQFAPFVRIERTITLGLDWSIETRAMRMAPQDGGFTVFVSLLAGEHVLTPGAKIDEGRIVAAIADGESSAAWSSRLDKSDALTLTAPPLGDRAEVWHVLVSPTWHADFSGVPTVAMAPADNAHDFRNFEFHPLPGETLTLRVTRPEPAPGATRAIDSVRLVESAGQRAMTTTLLLTLRASQGGEQIVTLPAGADVVGVRRNGEALNVRPADGKLALPIVPGTQTFDVRLRSDEPLASIARTPEIGLGLPAANIDVGLDLPADRWLLATSGPATGPAVLYWSELAIMLLIAWALSRTHRTPLRLHHWVLLGIGFSTFSWIALIAVAAWLFALDWRARAEAPHSALAFNAMQIGLAVLTLVALLCLVAAIPQGLLGEPDMHVAGNQSSAQALRWFADRSADVLPRAGAVTVPLWVYKLAMLAWALWLANAVVGWVRYGFGAWSRGGYWRALPRKAVVEIPAAPPPPGPK